MLTQGDVGGLWLGTLLLQGPLVHISHPTSLEGRTYSIKATVIDRLIWMGLTDIFLYSHPFASSFQKLVWFYFSHFKGPPSSALPVSPSCLLFSPRREITWVMSDRLGADLHNRQIKIRSFPCRLCLSLKLLCPTRKKQKILAVLRAPQIQFVLSSHRVSLQIESWPASHSQGTM